MSTITLSIQGMTCGHCERAVVNALSNVPGVERASVSLAERKAVVEGTPDAEALIAAVEEEGYEAELE